ncbi:Hydroxyproline O-galactosyltransferase HPGT3 [Cardamine amara subsp. amara]|uniref:Hydroxyproline O-galactosyltransferase HPGT3 n=1 Tax=Cardamine amara subsp. amara TaxID=228776 RepID=A0ABD1BDS2_CARAN
MVRLWQDAENGVVISNILKKNYDQKPKVLTLDVKLMVLGCKDLERKIVETELEFTLANSKTLSGKPKKWFGYWEEFACCNWSVFRIWKSTEALYVSRFLDATR